MLIKLFRLVKKDGESFWGLLSLFFKLKIFFEWILFNGAERSRNKLDKKLIISLTSYPPRFKTLSLTIKSLLLQSMYFDDVILWIAYQDKELLPTDVLVLQKFGLKIEYCEDLKSYKKIIPTLLRNPEAIVVIADDDVYYWKSWLAELVTAYDRTKVEVLCHRAHLITLNDNGEPKAYSQWKGETCSHESSNLIFPTGGGGVLYPPGVFGPDVINKELFMKLCPSADDVWLYWMASIGGAVFRKIGPRHRFVAWGGSQEVALFKTNAINGENDCQVKNMINSYGWQSK
jgi:hypothetical protein